MASLVLALPFRLAPLHYRQTAGLTSPSDPPTVFLLLNSMLHHSMEVIGISLMDWALTRAHPAGAASGAAAAGPALSAALEMV
jgi:hypothetical protein